MHEGNLSDIIRTSLDGIRELTESDTFVGGAIETKSGVTVIPVSKISLGFATGGVDFGQKKINAQQNFGGGGGSGVSITPMAFLAVQPNGEIKLVKLYENEKAETTTQKIVDLIAHAPRLIDEIKSRF